MGYRNSTPTNVILAESKILKMEDRAGTLARNYWVRTIAKQNSDISQTMNKLREIYNRINIRGETLMLIDTWREIDIVREDIEKNRIPGIYANDYWIGTRKIRVDTKIGKIKQLKTKT